MRRLASRTLAFRAVRSATPYSQLPSKFRVANRSGLAGQDKEDSLEGILGVVTVTQKLLANSQYHGAMAHHESGKGRLAGGIAPRGKPFDELAVGEPGDGTAVKERFNPPDHRW